MRRTRRGGVLILTLGILTALVLVLAAAVSSQRQSARAERNRMDQRLAEIAARAGIQRAIASLATQAASPTTSQDEWATLGTQGNENFLVTTQQRFRFQILDAASLINLNTAAEAQLLRLPLTQEQVDCLLDFREASRTPRADGAKDEYYGNLTNAYNTKLLPFETVDELLQVKDFTPDILYNPQTAVASTATPLVAESNGVTPVLADLLTVDSASSATSSAGAGLPALAQANIQQIQRAVGSQALATQIFQRRATFQTMGQVLAVQGLTTANARSLVNAFRVGGTATLSGKINLNTATDNVLNSIPNLAPDIVSAIISRQTTGFTQLGDIFDVPGYTIAIARQTIDQFAINSSVFIVRVVGTAGQQYDSSTSANDTITPADTWAGTAKVALIAIVKIQTGQPPRILRIERPPQPDVEINRWGWDAATNTDTDLRVSQ